MDPIKARLDRLEALAIEAVRELAHAHCASAASFEPICVKGEWRYIGPVERAAKKAKDRINDLTEPFSLNELAALTEEPPSFVVAPTVVERLTARAVAKETEGGPDGPEAGD